LNRHFAAFLAFLIWGLATGATAESPPLPADEVRFNAIIADTQAAYYSAPNAMAKGAVRPDRRAKLCDLLKSPSVQNWVGTIWRQDSTTEGKGVLEVRLARNLRLATSNNAQSDRLVRTLLEPGSEPFKTVVALKRNDPVVFSGDFIRANEDCVLEKSETLSETMLDPVFVFRFRSIRKP
jgi:hypothetical protein